MGRAQPGGGGGALLCEDVPTDRRATTSLARGHTPKGYEIMTIRRPPQDRISGQWWTELPWLPGCRKDGRSVDEVMWEVRLGRRVFPFPSRTPFPPTLLRADTHYSSSRSSATTASFEQKWEGLKQSFRERGGQPCSCPMLRTRDQGQRHGSFLSSL